MYTEYEKQQAQKILKSYGVEMETSVDKIEKLSNNIKQLLITQIHNELKTSQQYKQNASWMDANSFIGGQKIFLKWSNEEIEHMNNIYAYLFDQNCKIVVPEKELYVKIDFANTKEVFEETLKLEMTNTEQWRNIALESKNSADFQTYAFAEGYLKEQIEEENKVRNILFKINLGIPNWELDELLVEM